MPRISDVSVSTHSIIEQMISLPKKRKIGGKGVTAYIMREEADALLIAHLRSTYHNHIANCYIKVMEKVREMEKAESSEVPEVTELVRGRISASSPKDDGK